MSITSDDSLFASGEHTHIRCRGRGRVVVPVGLGRGGGTVSKAGFTDDQESSRQSRRAEIESSPVWNTSRITTVY